MRPGAERIARGLARRQRKLQSFFKPRTAHGDGLDSHAQPREAAGAVAQRVEERLDLGLLGDERRELGDRLVELQRLAVDDAIRLANVADLLGREVAALRALPS